VRFRFIEEHRFAFSIGRVYHVLNVGTRGLRAFRSSPASRRQRSDLVTLAHIKEQSRLSLGSYGRPRMTEELKDIGLDIGHRRVGRFPLIAASSDYRAVDAPERHISDQNT
jgi:putative transposase